MQPWNMGCNMHMSHVDDEDDDEDEDEAVIGLVRRNPVHNAARVPLKLVRNESTSPAARN